ncbi:MAG: UDP-N-acetylmuramate--L-alanine ligase [Alphaproteobacteria bacterium]|nr:MAG: UDP-N-acetylmuramate--L-alanine ligase [Alphaproteobacteria bacterium]
MRMPRDIGPFHIVGIGGIGMSAIAEVMHDRGYEVRGSDLKENRNVRRLMTKGIRCFIGHDAANIEGANYVVLSSAVKAGNPEYDAARKQGIPVIRRAAMLAELMRECETVSVTGTHGKTTTTSLVAELLESAGLDPTVISGGIIESWGSNARIGQGEWMVVEADESDGTFIELPTRIGVVTNIDPEHMDYWHSLEALHGAFKTFFDNIPFYGLVVAGLDHPIVREMVATVRREESGHRVLTYGVADDADVRLANYRFEKGAAVFDAQLGPKVPGGERILAGLRLPLPGRHNALNALAALCVALEAGIPDAAIRACLEKFGGVSRRFTLTGSWNGVRIYDDYAHHPVEIAAALKAARSASEGRVIAIVEPHRFTRLKNLFGDFCTCFGDADTVIVTPVYSAGEEPMEGVDREALIEGLKRQGHGSVLPAEAGAEALSHHVRALARPGDLVIGMGAGTITEWMHLLPKLLPDADMAAGGAA